MMQLVIAAPFIGLVGLLMYLVWKENSTDDKK